MSELTVHCLVKNEEKWIWFALSSILDIAKEVLIFDTGSTDDTVKIIKTFKNKKIIFEQKGESNAKKIVELRKQQLARTKTQWFLILDGDEIWPTGTKKELIEAIGSAKKDDWAVVIRAWNLVGDIYHYHPESKNYHWPFAPINYKGWANLRVIRRDTPGLRIRGTYPLEAYVDRENIPIQNYGAKHLIFLKNRYFHTTYLQRSSTRKQDNFILNRNKKNKHEIGYSFPKDFKYPEVFYAHKPDFVDPPFRKRGFKETLKHMFTLLQKS